MPVRVGSGLSTVPEAREGAIEAAARAAADLAGSSADLALVFATGAHLAAPEATLEAVNEVLDAEVVVGCGAGGVVGAGREVEGGTAVTVWAADLDGGRAVPFHAETHEVEGGTAVVGLPDLEGAGGALLLPDPAFPTDGLLQELARRAPGVPVLGGLSSARTLDGSSALFLGDSVASAGAVGVRLDDVELLPCVSQGATPIGPALEVTSAEGHVIATLDDKPAVEALRDIVADLGPRERAAVAQGLLLGVAVESGTAEHEQRDFLVRGLLGGDPDAGTIAIGAPVAVGQVVQLHARDAESADRDLRAALALRREALGGRPPAGAVVFTCNGRGRGMFGVDDHDALALEEGLAGAPTAGFFAAGEIGPVGGAPFLHGFTATVALFT